MADENVTDLTVEESGDDNQTEQEKPSGEEKEKKEKKKKDKDKDAKPGEEKKKGIGVLLIMLVVAIILVGGYVTALMLNVFNTRAITAELIRDPITNFIVWLDPRFSKIDFELREIAQAREDDLNAFEADLLAREEDLLARESIADTREMQLDRRTAELEKREKEFWELYERTIPIYRRPMTPQDIEEMESLAITFTRMSPAEAADILVRLYTLNDTAEILYFMSERNRASILAAFDPNFAAEVTNYWLYT